MRRELPREMEMKSAEGGGGGELPRKGVMAKRRGVKLLKK